MIKVLRILELTSLLVLNNWVQKLVVITNMNIIFTIPLNFNSANMELYTYNYLVYFLIPAPFYPYPKSEQFLNLVWCLMIDEMANDADPDQTSLGAV